MQTLKEHFVYIINNTYNIYKKITNSKIIIIILKSADNSYNNYLNEFRNNLKK